MVQAKFHFEFYLTGTSRAMHEEPSILFPPFLHLRIFLADSFSTLLKNFPTTYRSMDTDNYDH